MSKSTDIATLKAIERLQCGINALVKKSSGGGGGGDASASNQLIEISNLSSILNILDNCICSNLSEQGNVLSQINTSNSLIATILEDLYTEQRVDFEVKTIEDSNGDIYLLRISLDETTGSYQVDYIDAEGNVVNPQLPIKFLSPNNLLTSILSTLNNLASLKKKREVAGAFLNTDNVNTSLQGKAFVETGIREYKELTAIFHGTGGSYNGIPAYDGRVYIFKVEEGAVRVGDDIVVPTTVSPVTGILGLEIIYIANTI